MSLSKLILLTTFISLIFIGCKKNILDYGNLPEEILFSCADYSKVTDPNFDSDNLYAFWEIFIADAKCSMTSSPEYNKINTDVNIFYEYESDALFASGQVLDYGAYAASSCDDSRVRVGIAFRYWSDINIWQKLGLMYHEFGHDVLRYAHSSNPDDIMHPSSPFANTYNGFIESKNRFFEKKFDGLRYLDCSWYENYIEGNIESNIPHASHDCSIDHK